jgi:predicted NBD/HSP70 family sugar kinase
MRSARRSDGDAGAGAAAAGPDAARLAALGEEALDLAARTVANLAITLDPEVVAVSGGMMRSADVITPALAAALSRLVPFPPRLVAAHFADHAPLAGACLLAYRAAGLATPASLDLGPVADAASTGSGVQTARPAEQPERSEGVP